MGQISRRAMIKTIGGWLLTAAGLAFRVAKADEGRSPAVANHRRPVARSNDPPPTTYIFFNPEEAAFIEAAVARLIPADEEWGGALEAGVPNYIDKQLVGAWGAGERLYRSGPWYPGTPEQGYQLPFTPGELFHTALGAINKSGDGVRFVKMTPNDQDAYLKRLEEGGKDLGGVPSNVFFAQFLELTLEGFFADPVYGGNRDMISWRMIGFPGAYASYYDLVDKHGIKLDRPPMSLAEDARGHVHMNPGIPAKSP
ncbi:MAG: gluconate 2-dehydrogenase subunit 3 family protein [Deltaproteobacteria bacterium]|nr:gluconate 2-dehydrogenase subunit 3 family protein [Deltaproteobacteria bacterium]